MKKKNTMRQGVAMVIFWGISSTALAAPEPFVGEIMMFGGNFCPRGWTNADGQLLPVNQNQALFSIVGTMYGGDGRTTFGLPDLRGRVPLHAGQGPGLADRRQGSKGGEENHTLNIAEMPQHQHTVSASKGDAKQQSPAGNLLANQNRKKRSKPPSTADSLTSMHDTVIGSTGGNQAHNTMQPFLSVRFCIALQGIYPSRS